MFSAGLTVLAIIFILLRVVFDLRFSAIQKEPDQTPLFRRKMNHLRKIEQARHIRYLLFSGLMVGCALLVFIGSFLFLVDDHQKMKAKNTHLEDRVERLEQQQKQLLASIPLKNYPENGIGLNEYDWGKLSGEARDSDVQKEIETGLAQKTVSYFGSSDTTISLAVPKTMTLQLKGQTEDDKSMETIRKNLDAFAKEAEGILNLTELHVRMVTSMDKEKKVVYSVSYSRENGEEEFHKKNISEQNLKNDGGKG
ncbi:hypothetical protein RV07_GL003969 [Enterococcus malodoratus]|nr:hypothetical protein RV07_GL003969 [Enterococcus malodoratus]